MRFPIIKVKDNHTGREHIVGTDSHDCLMIENGLLNYFNLQNSEDSEHGTYSFLGIDDEFGARIEFVTFEELQKIIDAQNKIDDEQEKRRQEIVRKYLVKE